MKPTILALLSATMWLSSMPTTKAEIYAGSGRGSLDLLRLPSFTGTVSHVDSDARMMFESIRPAEQLEVPAYVKNWAIDISAKTLEFLVSGRTLKCNIVYRTQPTTTAICSIRVPSTHGLGFHYESLSRFIVEHGLGEQKCSDEDKVADQANADRLLARCDTLGQ